MGSGSGREMCVFVLFSGCCWACCCQHATSAPCVCLAPWQAWLVAPGGTRRRHTQKTADGRVLRACGGLPAGVDGLWVIVLWHVLETSRLLAAHGSVQPFLVHGARSAWMKLPGCPTCCLSP
jgi:hypothetical protein